MSGRNFSSSAAWKWTRLDHEGYIAKEMEGSSRISPYLAIEGWRFETVVYDWLHNLYLGCGRDLFASGLKLMIRKGVWAHLGTDHDEILSQIHAEMHRSCASFGLLGWKWAFPFGNL